MAVYAAQSIVAKHKPGFWLKHPREKKSRHPEEPYVFLGTPPTGITHQYLKAKLHLGDRSVDVCSNPVQFCSRIQEIEGCPEEISDLLVAAQTRDWDKHTLEYLAQKAGIPLDRSFSFFPPMKEYRFTTHQNSNWVKWMQLLLVATGSSQPSENRLTGIAELLKQDIKPWMMLGVQTWRTEIESLWKASGGSIVDEAEVTNCNISTDVIGEKIGWPQSRFVQVVGSANGKHSGELHVSQPIPEASPIDENLIVGCMRMGDSDSPAKDGRRVFVGAWFDNAWFTDSMFAKRRIHKILKAKANEWYSDFTEEEYHIPNQPTRTDGAFDRKPSNKNYRKLQQTLNGNRMLGILGLPKSFHFAKTESKIFN